MANIQNVSFVNPQNQAELQRIQYQQALAQQLMGSGGVPEDFGRQRVMPQYTLGHGLTDLATKLTGAYMQRKATERTQKLAESMRQQQAEALRNMLGGTVTEQKGGAVQMSPDEQSVRGAPVTRQRTYEEDIAASLMAMQAGVPKETVEAYLKSREPTSTQKDAQFAFGNTDLARGALRDELLQKGLREVDGRLVDAFGRVVADMPMRKPGIQFGTDAQGNLVASQIPGFAGANAGIAGAEEYAKEAAGLTPDLMRARAAQAGAIQGAQQANTIFTGQTVTGPDGRVYQDVPVWGAQIPGIAGPVAPPGAQGAQAPTLGADKRKADTEATITSQRLQSLADNAKQAESILSTLQQIKQFMDAGALGTGPIDRAQRAIHDYGFPTDKAANTKQIEQLGAMLQLARGSLGTGVSVYDAQVYSKAAGDFANAQNQKDRENAYRRMVESVTNIMNKANSAIAEYQRSGQAPAFGQPPQRIYTPQESAADLNARVQSYYGQ